MTRDRRYATRYPFVAAAEIFELLTGASLNARTSDLSIVGCYLDTLNPLPSGTEVQLEITHEGEMFSTLGIVAHSNLNSGMGILFKAMSREQEILLQKWLDRLSGDPEAPPLATR